MAGGRPRSVGAEGALEKARYGLAALGADRGDAVVVGDTTYDIDMARAAGMRPIGVRWGYHPVAALREAGAELLLIGCGRSIAAPSRTMKR